MKVAVNAISLRDFRDYINELQFLKVEIVDTPTIDTRLPVIRHSWNTNMLQLSLVVTSIAKLFIFDWLFLEISVDSKKRIC